MTKNIYLVFLLSLFSLNIFTVSNVVKEQKTTTPETTQLTNEYTKLIAAATKVRENAYAPYSKFKVGAAVATHDGKIFTGCNMENASYGLTVCAERNAISKAISEGYKTFKSISIVLDDVDCKPCGTCRQVIREFGDNINVIMTTLNGKIDINKISDLLPKAFVLEQNKK